MRTSQRLLEALEPNSFETRRRGSIGSVYRSRPIFPGFGISRSVSTLLVSLGFVVQYWNNLRNPISVRIWGGFIEINATFLTELTLFPHISKSGLRKLP